MRVGSFSSRFCFMARAGAVGGALFAAMFENIVFGSSPLSLGDLLLTVGILVFLVWILILLLFGIWLRYTVGRIFIQSLVVLLLTATVIVWVYQIWPTSFIALFGYFIGIMVGTILCWLCSLLSDVFATRRRKASN